ncbi:MAG: class I SAM-dependent methyltransferase [Chloroflexaceae bacterium]|jgi:ubiquinone/menaquinone biosynthesis C-methylase UbiE|nr:class I SAM-dependent methyltransferase [Chloroflexaceae bacterium]
MQQNLPQPLVGATLHDQFFASVDAQMLEWLTLAPGSHVLDAGCGPGGMLPRFAAAVGPSGSVTGLDQNSEQLAEARQFVAANTHNGTAPVSLREGDLLALPFDDGSFELAWCSFVLHHIGDPVAAARELRRVVRPGGRLVVRETGVPLRMLPFDLGHGRPGLHDRLRVAFNQWFTAHRYPTPVEQPYPWGWTQVLRDAGCQQVGARTFWLELLPPFTPPQHDYLLEGLRAPLRHPERLALLDADDQQTLARLTDPNDPHYALNRPDLHVLAGISLYVGQV